MKPNLSCLLVSPQPGDRFLVEEALQQEFDHLQIKQAADVLSWQQALEAGGFELAIIGEAWPWAEISTLVQDLKKRHPECSVILLADPAGEEAAWEALGHGVDDYVLTSPEELRRLPKVVQAAKRRVRRLGGEICGIEATELLALFDQRKDAEEKLRRSEILYRSIFENTGTATCISDENTILLLVNDECTKLTGYSREELEGKKSWTEFVIPEDLKRLKEYHRLRPTAPGSAPKSYTLRWQDRQGRIRDMLVNIALIPGTKNTVASLLDITAQQQAQEALRESEERYRLLVENMNDGLGMQDENGVISFVNQRFCEMLGYSRDELLNRPLHNFLDAANQKILQKQRKQRQKGESQPYELTWTRKDGASVITTISPVPIFAAAGKFHGSFAVIADITARRRAEKALRESEEKYRAIFENTGTPMAIVNADNTLSLVNDEFAKLSGYSREEIEGKKNWMEFAAAEDIPKMEEYHRLRRIDPLQAPRNYEACFIDRHGERKNMLMTAAMIPGTNKSVGSLLDFTARKQAEQELEYEREKFQILAENLPFAMVLIDKDGTFKYINPRFIELFGYTLADVPDGKAWFRKAFPEPSYRHQVISSWVNDLERSQPGEKRPRTYTVTCKDGTEKIISFIPLQLDNGDNLMTCEDITEQHLAVEAVKQSEQRFRLLTENSMFHLRILEPDGTIRYESPTMENFLGYEQSAQVGVNGFDFVHPDDQAPILEKMRQMLENPGLVVAAEMRYRHQDGTWRWLDVKGKNLLHEPLINGIVLNGQDITERKQAEEAVKQSEQRFRLLMENSMSHLAIINADGNILYETPTIERTLGYEIGELMGTNSLELVHPEDLARSQETMMNLLASPGKVFSTVVRYRHKDGSWRFLDVKAKNLLDEPIIRGIVVNAHDITQRTEALEALRQSEAEKSLILRNIEDKVVYYDRDNRIIWANQAMADFAHLTSEEMMGRFCYEVLHQRQTPCPDCPVIRAMEAGQPSEIERVMPNGRILFYSSTPVKGEDGKIQGNVLLVRDITASKKAEEALKASEEKMRMVIESSPVGIRITQDGRHIYVNPALMYMFGYAHAWEIVGQPINLLFVREEGNIRQQEQPAANHAGKPRPSSYEAKCYKKDGGSLEVQVWQTEIEYQGAPAILDFVLDISEAKALRGQLLQAQKMEAMGTLAGGIAHDFNNILFPILVNTEMTLETLAPESPLRRRMERVFQACERAIDLVKQILSFSRREERELSPIRLTPIIEDALKFLRASLPTTIEMQKHLESAADTVLADPTQIQQVLMNLYTNAAYALRDRGGVIDISLRAVDGELVRGVLPPDLGPGPYLQLTVMDNGQGMDPATKERIMDPYFTTKKPGEGTGLGLAVVHGIIKRHGGAIAVESALGQGSSFHIFLPRAEGAVLKETKDPIPLVQGKESILLVDDEPEIVRALKQMLESLGYQVSAFTGSESALESFKLRPQDFDLVITDQTMPHLTGGELAREMLTMRPDLPIILCTGYSEAVSPEKVRAMGIREFILKPVTTRVMAETIRRTLAS
ncbi:MAG: PAS domain S-box protein [Desulfobaccales bacterium]